MTITRAQTRAAPVKLNDDQLIIMKLLVSRTRDDPWWHLDEIMHHTTIWSLNSIGGRASAIRNRLIVLIRRNLAKRSQMRNDNYYRATDAGRALIASLQESAQ